MNWSILVTGAIALFSAVYYFVWARKNYHGPVIETSAQYVQEASTVIEQDKEMGSNL